MTIYKVEECFAGTTWPHGYYMDSEVAQQECIKLMQESYENDVKESKGDANDALHFSSFHVIPCEVIEEVYEH